jgi:uncharacterized protein (TIGR03067 family)
MCLLPLFLLVATPAPAEESSKTDLESLRGTWSIARAIHDGHVSSPEKTKSVKLTFAADKFTVHGEKGMESVFKLNPSKKPCEIDVTPGSGPDKGMTLKGIYDLNGDELKLCIAKPGRDRPTEFTSKENTGVILIELKRDKH